MKLDDFTKAYIECSLWSSTDENDTPLDSNYGIGDWGAPTVTSSQRLPRHLESRTSIRGMTGNYTFKDKNMTLLKGTELPPVEQKKALARFVHRYTGDHTPAWVNSREWKPGKPYPLQFASDIDWLAHTLFAVKADRTLDERSSHCESSPTWPKNPELRK